MYTALWDKTRSFWDIKNSLSHEWAGERTSERSGGREWSKQSGVSQQVSGATASERVSGPVLTSCLFQAAVYCRRNTTHEWDESLPIFRQPKLQWTTLYFFHSPLPFPSPSTAGCLFYVTRIPERFFPGSCDIFLQGHTILHLFVNCTAFLQVYGFHHSALNRAQWNSIRWLYQNCY